MISPSNVKYPTQRLGSECHKICVVSVDLKLAHHPKGQGTCIPLCINYVTDKKFQGECYNSGNLYKIVLTQRATCNGRFVMEVCLSVLNDCEWCEPRAKCSV